MNNRQIEVFAAVTKTGTVSRAAEVLEVTQPGVSRMIAELERSIGFSLFDRLRNRCVQRGLHPVRLGLTGTTTQPWSSIVRIRTST